MVSSTSSIDDTRYTNVTRWRAIVCSRWCGSRSPPDRTTTVRPPHTSGRKISLIEMSNDSGALNSDASECPKWRIWPTCHSRRSLIASCLIIAPLGRPVEPDVNITYASCAPAIVTSVGSPGNDEKAHEQRSTATASGSPARPVPRSRTTCASVITDSRRDAGHCGSSGTNAAPACSTASRLITISAERSSEMPTTCSVRTPRSIRKRVSWVERSNTSP